MNLILLENIEKLGFKDEIVKVKNGYGRNFLIPKGKAILATESSVKILKEKLSQQSKKEEENIAKAQEISENLKKLNLKIKAKVSSGNKLFGSIKLSQLMSELDKNEQNIDKKFVKIPTIKEIGKYNAEIRLHRSVSLSLTFEVIAE